MLTIPGKYSTITAYLDKLDNSAMGQLAALANQPFTAGAKIRIMPDAHAGAGCVIGTTMTISDKIVPNLVGVDISCGMEVINIGQIRPEYQRLDSVIRKNVPTGKKRRKTLHRFAEDWDISELVCKKILDKEKTLASIGSLGGGNHFIEIDRDQTSGDYYLIIHSGSRNPGLQVANHYQKIAGENKQQEVPYQLAWLCGDAFEDYLHDMKRMEFYADLNRKAIADEIIRGMKWKAGESFTTAHNYLDTERMILRKGAVSALKGEKLLIPLNMRDGSLLCEGLGNSEWNYSAPHGAGRLYSRSDAKNHLTLTQFKKDMDGIYSSCVSSGTIDESPGAYKPMEEIIGQIGETVKIQAVLKPVYNYKAQA